MNKLEQLQDEAIELIKNKKENKKMKKEPKAYTVKQIIKSFIVTIALLSLGAYAGITIQSAINSHIKSEVTEQIKSFTVAE